MRMALNDEISARVVTNFSKHISRDGPNGCWEWTSRISAMGYGRFSVRRKDGGVQYYSAHRMSYSIHKGPIPDGLCVLHSCDNPKCVNPEHLRAGTQSDNIKDRMLRGRTNRHRSPPKKLTLLQVHEIRNSSLSAIKLSKKYGVHRINIYNVRNGKSFVTA